MKCIHCGDGKNVIKRTVRVSEGVMLQVPQCIDEVECWARWDEQNGIENSCAKELLKRRLINA